MNETGLPPVVEEPVERLHRLHWSSLLFDAISQIRSLVVPAILALLGAARGDSFWIYISLIFLGPALLYSVFRYATLSFRISHGQLVIKQGLIFRNVRSVPVERIQNIDFVQNLLHRAFGVAEVRVETAAGSEPEATLRVLSLEQVERLRSEVFESRHVAVPRGFNVGVSDGVGLEASPVTEETASTQAAHSPSTSLVLQIPLSWLIYAGLASNRGTILIGVVAGSIYEFQLFKRLDIDKFADWLPQNLDHWFLAGVVAIGFLVLLLILRMVSIAWYILRFANYRLERRNDDLRVSCGLTTKVQATVPRRRVQFISVHRNLLMRFWGLASVRIETAGSGAGHDDASKSVSSRWFIPVVTEDRLAEVLREIRPDLVWNENEFQFKPMASRAVTRRVRLAILVSLLFGVVGFFVWQPWGALVGVVLLPIMVLAAILSTRALQYARTDQGVVFRSGVLIRKTSMTFFEKIQSIQIQQSPLDRRWGMAKLSVDTAAAGPAEHKIEVPMLDASLAMVEQVEIKQLAALHQPVYR